MIYVFDTSSLSVLFNNFYESRFPKLWKLFDALVEQGRLVSVREVATEIRQIRPGNRLTKWVKANSHVFQQPTREELEYVKSIFKFKGGHFQALVEEKKRLTGRPVADPFVIAKANALKASVVTQETLKENAAKIPNVCQHVGVDCINLEEFMEREGWSF